MTTTQSTLAVTYNVSEGLGLLHAYILNFTTPSGSNADAGVNGISVGGVHGLGAGGVHNLSGVADVQTVTLTNASQDGGGGARNRVVSLGPPWRLTVYSDEHLISTSVVLGIMILFCIIGNCFVIAAVILERSLHNVANYLILSLAVADLMVAVLVMPLSVVSEISRVWFLHSEVCNMWISFDVLCCTASILHLVAIAIDRYWAVTSIDYIRRRSARRILLMILAVWIVALTISIPPLFGWRDPDNDPADNGVCIISQDHGYTIFSTVGAFYLPMFIMICIYARIYMVARRRIRKKKFNKKAKKANGAASAKTCLTTMPTTDHITVAVTQPPEYSVVSNCNGCSPEKERGEKERGEKERGEKEGGEKEGEKTEKATDSLEQRAVNSQFHQQQQQNQTNHHHPPHPPGTPQNHVTKNGRANTSSPLSQLKIDHPDLSGDNDSLGTPAGNGQSRYSNGVEMDPPTTLMDDKTLGGGGGRGGEGDGASRPCLPSSRQREKLEQKREKKAARTLAIITGAFLLCWLPFFILALCGPFIRNSVVIPPVVDSLLLWLGYLNSLLNPIIYTIFSPEFRNAFRKILFGKYSRRARGRGGR